MSSLKQKEYHLTWTYLFSYLWLTAELIIIVYLIDTFGTGEIEWFLPLAILLFARLYHWLNFSPETLVQTVVVLGVLPLIYLAKMNVLGIDLYVLMIIYLALFMTLGIVRNRGTKYVLTDETVEIQGFKTRSYQRDPSRSIRMLQHSRGRALNFACILIPIKLDEKKRNPLMNLIFSQKNEKDYEGYVRLDGIFKPSSNPSPPIS